MKLIRAILWSIVIAFLAQSFSLHKCRNDVKIVLYNNGKEVLQRVFNGNTDWHGIKIDGPRMIHTKEKGAIYYDYVKITGGNP